MWQMVQCGVQGPGGVLGHRLGVEMPWWHYLGCRRCALDCWLLLSDSQCIMLVSYAEVLVLLNQGNSDLTLFGCLQLDLQDQNCQSLVVGQRSRQIDPGGFLL